MTCRKNKPQSSVESVHTVSCQVILLRPQELLDMLEQVGRRSEDAAAEPKQLPASLQTHLILVLSQLFDDLTVDFISEQVLQTRQTHAMTNTTHAMINMTHAMTNMTHAIINMPHAMTNMTHAMINMTHAMTNMTHAIINMSYAMTNMTHVM